MERVSLARLVQRAIEQAKRLVQHEIALLIGETLAKVKKIGLGAGIIVGAVIFLFLFVATLLTAIVLALSLLMPGWLAALIVAVPLAVAVVLLALRGIKGVRSALPLLPELTLSSVRTDISAVRGKLKR